QSGMLSPPPELRSPSSPNKTPSNIGNYLIVGEVGDGSSYRAFHPTLRMELILKPGPGVLEEDSPERSQLLAQGRRLAALAHPGLARVFDLDFHQGRPFLVWEYVAGPTLEAEFCGRSVVSPRQAAGVVLEIASAVEA